MDYLLGTYQSFIYYTLIEHLIMDLVYFIAELLLVIAAADDGVEVGEVEEVRGQVALQVPGTVRLE